jgi:hypothetical protein
MSCRCAPRVILSEIFRQLSDGSGAQDIARNAQMVNHGQMPTWFRSTLIKYQSENDDIDVESAVDGDANEDSLLQHEYKMDRKNELFEASVERSKFDNSISNGCVVLSVSDEQETSDKIINAVAELMLSGRNCSDIQVISPNCP